MNAEIITIGDELLLGQTIDTNSAWLGQNLAKWGIHVQRKTAVSDKADAIVEALETSLNAASLVIITGGLGPTRDDITKHTLAQFFNCGYRTDASVMAHLEKLFAKRGRTLLEVNKLQAELPEACETLHNAVGTAPGMWFQHNKGIVVSLPGVPNEVYYLMEHEVLPRLQKAFSLQTYEHRTLLCLETPESILSKHLSHFEDELPEGYSLAYLPQFNSIRLRLSQKQQNQAEDKGIEFWFERLQHALGILCFGVGDISAAERVAQFLLDGSWEVSGAESCTGGFAINQLLQVPGMSACVQGSMVAYGNPVKRRELGVLENTLKEHGAVSLESGKEMALGALKKFGSDFAFSTTGIAGPGGGTDEKPVGTVCLTLVSTQEPKWTAVEGLSHENGLWIYQKKKQIPGNRQQFMQRASNSLFALFQPWF